MRIKIFLICSLFFIAACEKDYYLTAPQVDFTKPVSYAANIQPILTKDCATAGCHLTGLVAPDLTSANSYLELTQDPGQYVDTSNAEESQLYKRIISTNPGYQMPRTTKLTNAEIGLILAWIKQGAQNN